MSSYLLLRNNQESGPFSLEEMKNISLNSYDLVWVVGKSAAWRYPGEIPELKSFVPVTPEQEMDLYRKKPISDSVVAEILTDKKHQAGRSETAENSGQRKDAVHSVYVNLPADRNQTIPSHNQVSDNSIFAAVDRPEPHYEFSNFNKNRSNRAARISGKLVWIGTLMLLFSSGILTGLFISDRRKIFSEDEIHTQKKSPVRQTQATGKKEILNTVFPGNGGETLQSDSILNDYAARTAEQNKKKLNVGLKKKNSKNNQDKKDSAANQTSISPSFNLMDSLKQNAIARSEMLSQKIKAHPENYISLANGRYSTGLFGGISAFPITVKNNSEVRMDLVIINIDYIQNNDKIFKTETVSLNDLDAGEAVTIKAPKSSRGVKVATRIRILNSRQIDLSYSN